MLQKKEITVSTFQATSTEDTWRSTYFVGNLQKAFHPRNLWLPWKKNWEVGLDIVALFNFMEWITCKPVFSDSCFITIQWT